VALLRGVNLGSLNKVGAPVLRGIGQRLGLTDPRTVVNSGNLVFRDARGEAELEPLIASAVAEATGVKCDVHVRDAAGWAEIMAGNPFADAAAERPSQLLVTVLRRPPDPDDMAALCALVTIERVATSPRATYIDFNGGLARSKLGNGLLGRKGVEGTSRNWNSVAKIGALLGLTAGFSFRSA